MKHLFTSESVTSGHPDKVCDAISDAIMDELIAQDPTTRAAVETMGAMGVITVAGEVATQGWVDVPKIVVKVLSDIGYDSPEAGLDLNTVAVHSHIHEQSPDISAGVSDSLEVREGTSMDKYDQIGAGDQGLMFGYAVNDTSVLMPLPLQLAHDLAKKLEQVRRDHPEFGFLPDGKTQVTVSYEDRTPKTVETIVVSTQHKASAKLEDVRKNVEQYVIKDFFNSLDEDYGNFDVSENLEILVNPAGEFILGSVAADCGLTGRKIIVDTYGGRAPHGGGAFCVDGDTEFMTSPGVWKKIKDYTDGDMVSTYTSEGFLSFERPSRFIATEAKNMWRIKKKGNLDMVVSEDHDIVYFTTKGNLHKKSLKNLLKDFTKPNGEVSIHGDAPITYKYNGNGDGNRYGTDAAARVQIAFCVDGNIDKNNKCTISLKKDSKINRLEKLLQGAKIDYMKKVDTDGFSRFYFVPPVIQKNLSKCFENPSSTESSILAEEVFMWGKTDGKTDKKIFRTSLRDEADFVQHVVNSCTDGAVSLKTTDRTLQKYMHSGEEYTRKSLEYNVSSMQCETSSLRQSRKEKIEYTKFFPENDRMYCFTVSTGMLVLRRSNNVFITGNCGKDSTKVDRSAAYMARWAAKNVVAAGLASECEIQVAYAIGKAHPVSLSVNTHGTGDDEKILEAIQEVFDFRPAAIIDALGLRQPIYSQTSAYGHFGKPNLPWEQTNRVDALKKVYETL